MMVRTVKFNNPDAAANVFGSFDSNLKILQREYAVSIANRDGEIKISGDNAESCARVMEALGKLAEGGETVDEQKVRYFMAAESQNENLDDDANVMLDDCICITSRGKPLKPKTIGQKKYTENIASNTVVLGIGPAGTGKTYLAVAMAVKAFRSRLVNRIILTRPAVEAGEKLGFLPGDLQNKVDPYLRPLYDALYEMLGVENFQKCMERGAIEIAPLAYMRGRTLDDSFIILDEAQNTTPEQMKMFLTRIGFGSKAVITGDITQIDLPSGVRSGLKEAMKILDNIDDIAITKFSERDVVRHPLVMKIIKAYEKYESRREYRKE